VEEKAFGVDEEQNLAEGPFSIIKRAFTHSFLNDMNLETLETLGDAVLNAAVTFIIVHNWPNLLVEVKQVANIKKYHTNNTNLAQYAAKLGLIRWIVRHADVFEALVGAIALIGELYIGKEMGFIYAKEFLVHFFSTEKWYPYDSEFYEVGETLYNDWVTALPKNAQPKLIKRAKRDKDTGMWHFTVSTEDGETSSVKSITAKMGVPRISFSAVSRKKDDAEHSVMMALAGALKLTRKDINVERDKKHASNAEIFPIVQQIIEIGAKYGKKVFVTGSKRAGKRHYVFVKEEVKAKMSKTTLTYNRFVVNGEGNNEKEALEDARGKMARGEFYKTVVGVEYEIWNPDATEDNDAGLKSNADRQGVPVTATPGKSGPRSDRPHTPKYGGKPGPKSDRGGYKPGPKSDSSDPPPKPSGSSWMRKK
jgi:hypothetical protein